MKNRKYYEQYIDDVTNIGIHRKKHHRTWKKIRSIFRQFDPSDLK